MTTPVHIVVNLALVYPLAKIFNFTPNESLFFVLSTVLIDLDHIYVPIRNSAFTPSKFYKTILRYRQNMIPGLYLFHSPEFNFLLFLLSLKYRFILIFFLSNLIHLVLDIYDHYRFYHHLHWIAAWSPIYVLIRPKGKYRLL